jgi:hypothetical protein
VSFLYSRSAVVSSSHSFGTNWNDNCWRELNAITMSESAPAHVCQKRIIVVIPTDIVKVPLAGNVVSVILQMSTFAILSVCLRTSP